jgi:hypothetical protein
MNTELELGRLRDEVERLTDQIALLRDTIEHDRDRNRPYYDPSWPYWPYWLWWPAPYYDPRPRIYWGTPPEITTVSSWTYRPTPEETSPTLAGSQTTTNSAWRTDTVLADAYAHAHGGPGPGRIPDPDTGELLPVWHQLPAMSAAREADRDGRGYTLLLGLEYLARS